MFGVRFAKQIMSGMTGVEFLKAVNERFPEISPHHVILLGYSEDKDIGSKYEEYKLFKFITNPWQHSELNEIILKVLSHRHK